MYVCMYVCMYVRMYVCTYVRMYAYMQCRYVYMYLCLTIEEVNTGEAPGLHGIPVELLRCGGDNIATAVYTFILGVWHGDLVPQDWVDAIMLSLYKSKGSK